MDYGRNEKCPCGSGKKYKKCCFTKEERKRFEQNLLSGQNPGLKNKADLNQMLEEMSKLQSDEASEDMKQQIESLKKEGMRLTADQMVRYRGLMIECQQPVLNEKSKNNLLERLKKLKDELPENKFPFTNVILALYMMGLMNKNFEDPAADMTPEQAETLIKEAIKSGILKENELPDTIKVLENISESKEPEPTEALSQPEKDIKPTSKFARLWSKVFKSG